MSYRGMRWFKCDLQVQTPEDRRHWQDPSIRLPQPATDKEALQAAARRYLRRCHEVDLEVIGVTDHNFSTESDSRRWFLTHLIELNEEVAQELGREPLTIFPGFEVDIGFHALCLFEPARQGRDLHRLSDLLTQMGLPPQERFDENGAAPLRKSNEPVSLTELLKVVQEKSKGLVIAAHACNESGIARTGRDRKDFLNPNLLCCEVSSFPLSGREKEVLANEMPEWKRERKIACIASSDAKSIAPAGPDGRPARNSLGYRWTWIKMSEPSIESLRQACLDPDSRIRPLGERPPSSHPRIHSLKVERARFLGDQEVFFSPNLTCIIGGRGSGKSTLFEYLRFCLRREKAEGAREQVDRILKTLEPASRLELRYRSSSAVGDELEDRFRFENDGRRAQIESREVANAATVFDSLRVTIFSQDELTEVARDPRIFQRLLDDLLGAELAELRSLIAAKKSEVKALLARSRQLETARERETGLAQEIAELERRAQAGATLKSVQDHQRRASEARLGSEKAELRLKQIEERLSDLAAEVEDGPAWGSNREAWPEGDFFSSLEARLSELHQQVAAELIGLRQKLAQAREGLFGPESIAAGIRLKLERSSEEFLKACVDAGIQPAELNRLVEIDRQLPPKVQALDLLRRQNREEEEAVAVLPDRLVELAGLWHRESDSRQAGAAKLAATSAIPRTDDGRSIIEIQVEPAGDRLDFLASWDRLKPADQRTRLARSWEELGAVAFEGFAKGGTRNPAEVVEKWLEQGASSLGGTNVSAGELAAHLATRPEDWEELRLRPVPDLVDAILFRRDGAEAGRLSRKDLSDGQRNTLLLLLLLLADGEGPILVDQPESEVDSRFLYDQLVPLVRTIKERRQIVFVTHNPNLPVNADAELVYALEAAPSENGARGSLWAEGGLDRESVKKAVLEVMEGSEEAFRRRREKYHF